MRDRCRGSATRLAICLTVLAGFWYPSEAAPKRCGDGQIDVKRGEECDGADLGGATCESFAFQGGELACSTECQYDTSGCTNAVCGNGVVEEGEDCDFGDLAGATCADTGFPYGTLSCGAGCVFDPSGCTSERFVLGSTGETVIDNETGLEWEKKTDDGTVHDKDNTYAWTSTGTDPDGPLFTDFLGKLNTCTSGNGQDVNPGFGGHCDWRVPQIDELRTILDTNATSCGMGSPCIDPIFGPTAPSVYWSASAHTAIPNLAWDVGFDGGGVDDDFKVGTFHARGVRSGSP